MALFGKKDDVKEQKEEKTAVTSDAPQDAPVEVGGIDSGKVLIKPHISEKTFLLGEKNVYVFEIAPRATKRDVARAITAAYKVDPVAVRIVRAPGKKTSRRLPGRQGRKNAIKKAYVTLKEADKLSLV